MRDDEKRTQYLQLTSRDAAGNDHQHRVAWATETHRSLIVALGLSALSASCAMIHHLDDYTTSKTGKQDDGVNRAAPPVAETAQTQSAPACGDHSDCDAEGGPRVCVQATHQCEHLTSSLCPRVYGTVQPGAIVIGTLLSTASDPERTLERAAALAAEEINASGDGGLPPASAAGTARPLIVLGCDTSDAVGAARHLASTLKVSTIIGPVVAEDVLTVTQQVTSQSGTLLMTPTSPASSITQLADNDLTWRTVSSDSQRAKLVIAEMNDLEGVLRSTRSLTQVKVGIVHRADALGTSVRDSISGKLIVNGRFITDPANASAVSVDSYPPGTKSLESTLVSSYASGFKPDLILITAAEQIPLLMVPLEQALTAARAVYRPYYVLTEEAKTDELLAAVTSPLPADIKRRIRGIGAKPDLSSAQVYAAFRAAFAARYGAQVTSPGAALSYDATYSIAYAIAAARDATLSGGVIAQGLRTLGVGDSVTVGASSVRHAMSILDERRSIALRGTFSLMQWDTQGDIGAGTTEVWCIGTSGGAPAFGSSGVTMDVQTQVVGGAFVQCQ